MSKPVLPIADSILGNKRITSGRALIALSVPLTEPGTTPRVFNFPAEFDGLAIDLLIDNLDLVGTLTFRLNSRAVPVKTIGAGGAITISDLQIYQLEIVTGTNWEVTFTIVPSLGRG